MRDASLPILVFAHAVFLGGRDTTVRRGPRWPGVPVCHRAHWPPASGFPRVVRRLPRA